MHVKEGSVFQLLCPDTKCNASIPPFVLKRLLTEEEFECWDRLVLKKALDSMSGFTVQGVGLDAWKMRAMMQNAQSAPLSSALYVRNRAIQRSSA